VGFLASRDNTLYAINLPTGESTWTYTTGTEIERQPRITDGSVYLITSGNGLQRLNRATGAALWKRPVPNVAHFLAENAMFTYATDRQGRLLVLDRARGVQLSTLGTMDFTIPVANEMSDRVFLAANDGLVICLHDRSYAEPQQNRRDDVRNDVGRNSPIVRQLIEPITMTGGLEETTLQEAVDLFTKRYKLPLVVAERAFADAGESDILTKPVSLKKFESVPLADVLQRLLKPVSAAFVVHPDYILIVPVKGNPPGQQPGRAPGP
jgi:hypothetical protein